MKSISFNIFCCVVVGMSSCMYAQQQEHNSEQSTATIIFPRGKKISNDNFKGTAYLKVLIAADSVNPTTVGSVTFEPGARTKWHSHPGGQILLAIDGVGYYQEKGHSKKILRRGDVVKCPPNVPHWHGASAKTPFVQVAVTNSHLGATVWLDTVTEQEYNSATKP